jgi:hypothetical protein
MLCIIVLCVSLWTLFFFFAQCWSLQILYGFSITLFWGDLKLADGLVSGHWFWGTTLYLAVLLTVLGKAALISECVFLFFIFCFDQVDKSIFPSSLWTKYTVAGKIYDLSSISVLTLFASHPRIICFYNAVSAPLCGRRTLDRFLDRVHWHCPTSVDKRSVLFCAPHDPYFLPCA